MENKVLFDRVLKDFKFLPLHIRRKALEWAQAVEEFGLQEVRKVPGYHDEPLKGPRNGQRSIRLSRSYRLIYVQIETNLLIIEVLEINKHEY